MLVQPTSSPRRTTSAGIGTEHHLDSIDETIRLPGFHRAGPSTPLDERKYLIVVDECQLNR
jgi:hypothetical protein